MSKLLCPICNTNGIISSAETIVTGDDSPDAETQIFKKMTIICRNPKCSKYQKEIGVVENEIQLTRTLVKETI